MKSKSVLILITTIVISSMLFSSGVVQATTVIPQEGEPNDEALIPIDKLPKELELARKADYRRTLYQQEADLDRSSTEDRSTGGPDGFGYSWDDTEPYSWIDAKTLGSNIGVYGGDNYTSSPVPIGFTFPFYGEDQTDVYITTEGLIDFFGPGLWYLNTSIPSTGAPDNFIAPYWGDLGMYNNGNRPEAGIYVYQGGIAPDRYFVVEWYRADLWYMQDYGNELADLTFQVILFETGDIVMQYQHMEGGVYDPSIGIEDPAGTDGLEYGYSPYDGLAIRFSYPEPSYRVKLLAEQTSGFVGGGMIYDYEITLINTGGLGADTYSLSVDGISPDSGWSFDLLETDGVTPVTGPIALEQGESTEFIGRLSVSEGRGIGDSIIISITATSLTDPTASKTIQTKYAIPAAFAQIFYDELDNGASAYLVTPNSQQKHVISGGYASDDMAIVELPNRNQLHIGIFSLCVDTTCEISIGMSIYWIIDRFGNLLQGPAILSDLREATVTTYDSSLAVDVNPNGDVGITWVRTRYLYDNGSWMHNSNIHYMVLNQDGSIKIPRANLTLDWTWYQSEVGSVYYRNPKIAATDNGNFTIAWEENTHLSDEPYAWKTDIYQTVINNAGNTIKNITKITNGGPAGEIYLDFSDLTLTTVNGNNVFITWNKGELEPSEDGPWMYMNESSLESSVYLDNGNLLSSVSSIEGFYNWYPDVTQLSDGTIMLAADGYTHIAVQLYDGTSYNPTGGILSLLVSLEDRTDKLISVTHDTKDHGIITWGLRYENQDHLSYALINSDGNILTEPMAYYQAGASPFGGNYVYSSRAGSGVTTYTYSYPPEFTSEPVEDAIADLLYSYPITATDADLPDDSLTFVDVGLPSWLNLTDYGDGTALLSGTPSSLDIGVLDLELVVEDSYGMSAAQSFTLTVQSSEAPAFTSADTTLFTEGVAGAFTVETSGAPDPAIGLSGSLPTGVSFLDNGDGTATLSGTPDVGTGGSDYPVTLSAANGIAPDASQSFTLTVGTPPEFDSGDTSSGMATVGEYVELYETVTSFPENPLITISGALPAGLSFLDLGMGTAVISGTPEVGTGGVYPLILTADNGTAENDTLDYTLTVKTDESIGPDGGTITSDDGTVIITVPSGSLSEEITFEFIPLDEPTEGVPSSLVFAGTSFQLIAKNGSDVVVYPTFDPPLVVEIHYDEADLGDLPEDELILYYWDTDTLEWLDAAETCTSGAGYTYFPESDYFTVEICHLTEFAVMGEGGMDIFLPLIMQ